MVFLQAFLRSDHNIFSHEEITRNSSPSVKYSFYHRTSLSSSHFGSSVYWLKTTFLFSITSIWFSVDKKYVYHQSQYSKTWDSKGVSLIAQMVRAFGMNPKVGGWSPPQVETFAVSKPFGHFHKNIKNECGCPGTVSISNVNSTSKIFWAMKRSHAILSRALSAAFITEQREISQGHYCSSLNKIPLSSTGFTYYEGSMLTNKKEIAYTVCVIGTPHSLALTAMCTSCTGRSCNAEMMIMLNPKV